jgi:hypothetical protein
MTESNPFADRVSEKAEHAQREASQETAAYVSKRVFENRVITGEKGPGYTVDGWRGRTMDGTTVRATKKQRGYITSLLAERDLSGETRPKWVARLGQLTAMASEVDNLDFIQASRLIEYLVGMPTKVMEAVTTEVPAGRYGVEINGELWFVRVDRPTEGKWAGRVFVKRQVSDEHIRLYPNVQRSVLATIAKQGARECSATYGREFTHCGVCGRGLTDAESRAEGIGPVCRSKNGW